MHFILHQLGFSDSYVLRYLDTRFLFYLDSSYFYRYQSYIRKF